MNEARQILVKALRSGDYKQCTGKLCNVDKDGNETHCCLGVATEEFIKLHPGVITSYVRKHQRPNENTKVYQSAQGDNEANLFDIVRDWLGFRDKWGSLKDNSGPGGRALCNLNDGGMSFEDISNVIERDEVQESVS